MSEEFSGRRDPEQIRSMFDSIARRYDRANSTLSLGIHHWWRRRLVSWSGAASEQHVLDCATGTADLAIAFKKVVGSSGIVIATDFSSKMLKCAKEKIDKRKVDILLAETDVMNLPYETNRFDITSIAFGIRNVSDPARGITELARVTKPGGVVMILEFGQPTLPIWRQFFSFYSKFILPQLGGLVTGKQEAYRYLERSSASFPCEKEFVALMASTGAFTKVECRPLTGEIAWMYKGKVAPQ